jgi:hypothetical protein
MELQFKNNKLVGEDWAELHYQPLKCGRKYRLTILRKNIRVYNGEKALFDEVRHFFYITNRKDKAEKIIALANGQCDQKNVIEQLKNGVNAMRMPIDDLCWQLGLHGDGVLGLESQSLVWTVGAQP